MSGGTISGNTTATGDGVFVTGGTFKKENTDTGNSGVIYGSKGTGRAGAGQDAIRGYQESANDANIFSSFAFIRGQA
jgi:hypothetical protein